MILNLYPECFWGYLLDHAVSRGPSLAGITPAVLQTGAVAASRSMLFMKSSGDLPNYLVGIRGNDRQAIQIILLSVEGVVIVECSKIT